MDDSNAVLKRLWGVELEILDVIHRICVENGLNYSLAYGTLIGAVRHKGFIPWDDDIDIIMPRDDYERLISIWGARAPKEYILQNVRTDPDFTQSFTKIRKAGTTFLQYEYERTKKYHKGIFVDVFACDRLAPGIISKKVQYLACAIGMLYNRGHASGKGGITGCFEKMLLKIPREKYAKHRESAEKVIQKWNGNRKANYFVPCTLDSCNIIYPGDIFDDLKNVEFEGKKYRCVTDEDSVLKAEYGDYMMLPSVEERVWRHHPIILDFEHDYEETSDI